MTEESGSVEGDIRIGSLDTAEQNGIAGRTLGRTNSQALYSPGSGAKQGYLLYLRGNTLVAQAFDAQRFETVGDAVPVAEKVPAVLNTLRAPFSISLNGALAYRAGATANLGLIWFDRAGERTGTVGDSAVLLRLQLSPDGKRAAAAANTAGNTDIWIYDLARNLRSRFTFDPALDREAVWSPDGKIIVFASNRRGHFDLYRKVADGTGTEELLYGDATDKYATSWSPDGKYLLYFATNSNGVSTDIFALPLAAGGKPVPFVKTEFNEQNPQFSPDGQWVAYQSNESGSYEIYLTPFPGPGGKRQVSTSGGTRPRWRADGKELFYLAQDGKLLAAEISLKADNASVGGIRPLFGGISTGGGYRYDVSPDGQRILAIAPAEENGAVEPITLVQNWMAALKPSAQR